MRHQTRRQGRPYTLVLTKTGELFTREKDARHKAVTDLAWLTSAWGTVRRERFDFLGYTQFPYCTS